MLKPLNQTDFNMKIIKDLGRQYPTGESKQKKRMGIFECPVCRKQYNSTIQGAKKIKSCYDCRKFGTHNLSAHHKYKIWSAMRDRCNNQNNKRYPRYGGRGITYSKEFNNFKVWLVYVSSLDNYEKVGFTLDRIDNNGNYEKGNLRWATYKTQNINRGKTKRNSSGFIGVSLDKWTGRYSCTVSGKWIGRYISAEDAARARDDFIVKNNLPHKLQTRKLLLVKMQ